MGSLGVTFTFLAMFSMFFVLTQYLQYVRGYSPLSAGVHQLPFAFVLILVSPRSADFAAKVGARRAVATGMALLVFGLLLMSFIRLDTPYWYIVVSLVTMASGVGMAIPSLSSGIVQSVPQHKAGVGSAVNDTTREVGGAIGIAVVGSVITSIYRSHVAPALESLPPELAQVARGSVAKAMAVADSAGGAMSPEAATEFSRAVRQSFVDGAHVGLRISAALVAVAALVVTMRLRGRDQIDAVDSF
jgi:MFS-type transporter involved in bile tolerance (Atg22 family)